MQTIRELLSRDLAQPIEEVIKLDQQDEKTVHTEITEYVATDRIKGQYREILQAIADAPGDPTEGVGVWISGFFGSGKSSFAKNLGYVLSNREVLDQPAAQLFVQQLQAQSPGDPDVERIADLVSFINSRFDAHVIMFDVQVDRAVRRTTEPIAEIMYSVLLRELDYAKDYDVAALEIELEGEGRLAEFVQACARMFGDQLGKVKAAESVPVTLPDVSPEEYGVWRRVRKGAQRIQRASAVLHEIDPRTYPTPDSWAASLQKGADITIRTLVDRTFELTARRRPGHTMIFIIDEVGQYVARSAEKIENLRAVVEHFGQESKNRVQAGQAVAPVWVIVTSQEKLDEVVAAIDDKRVELAKLQDRFPIRIDMAPADIREVATRRVLAKKPEAEPVLHHLFEQTKAMLQTHTKLERTARQSEVSADEFVQFYPYLPHFVDLSIDIVSGMRLQPGAPKHIGGSNRTIIKQAYEMLVSDRVGLADAPVGALVSLDRIFDLIEGNLSSEKQKDITDITQCWPETESPWPARTAKAIALLEYVRDLPRTDENLAALLYRELGDASPLPQVQEAIKALSEADFVRQTENGWKLQTAQEKSWTAERNAHSPNRKQQNDILEDRLQRIFSEPGRARYRYSNRRNFRVGVTWNNRTITSGEAQVPLVLYMADGPDVFQEMCDQARDDSRAEPHQNDLFWVMSLVTEIDEIVAEIYRSRQMVGKYDQLRAQGKITKEEASSLAAEKTEVLRLEERLKARLEKALADGKGFFRGVSKDGAALGKTLNEILKALFDYAVPDLYPKLEMGARPLKGAEAEEILKAANLNGLSKVFYAPPDGLELVIKEGAKYVVNPNAPIVKEVADYLASEHSYGNRVTGRTMENHFGSIGYGWEREILWLVLATLLRGGAIEVTYQGRRYRNHLDPQVRAPFSATNAFRAASFAPRKAPDLRTLVAAARRYEDLTGEDVDVEESTIAQAFQRLARAELEALLPVDATVRAHHIPLTPVLQVYRTTLETILNSASDDCVNILAGEGVSFQQSRDQIAAIRQATDEKGLARLRQMRTATQRVYPLLQAEGLNGNLADQAQVLRERLEDGAYYIVSAELNEALASLETTYHDLYLARHSERATGFTAAVDSIKALPDWALAPEEMQETLLKPLADRIHDLALPEGELVCTICRASLTEMASDLAAVDGLCSNVLWRVQELTAPEEKIERVRVSDVAGIGQTLSTSEEVEALLEQLRDHLLKLVAAGIKVVLE
ncbi:MAG: BREX system P-loop protein BrxC [Chloroflexi bacterium]|nr:MAG: BREX system P-loop protein BrxC [Chloroflexota bacterium]